MPQLTSVLCHQGCAQGQAVLDDYIHITRLDHRCVVLQAIPTLAGGHLIMTSYDFELPPLAPKAAIDRDRLSLGTRARASFTCCDLWDPLSRVIRSFNFDDRLLGL